MLSGCARCRDGTEQARTGADTGGFKVGDRVRAKVSIDMCVVAGWVGEIKRKGPWNCPQTWCVAFPQSPSTAWLMYEDQIDFVAAEAEEISDAARLEDMIVELKAWRLRTERAEARVKVLEARADAALRILEGR